MLSRKFVNSFINARAVASRKDEAETMLPTSFFFNGPIKESSVNSIPSLNSNMDVNRIYNSLIPETDGEKPLIRLNLDFEEDDQSIHRKVSCDDDLQSLSSNHSKRVEDGLRHVSQVKEIKQKREAARRKYQDILLKRSGSNISSASSVTSSSTTRPSSSSSSTSHQSSKVSHHQKKHVKKPSFLRQVSEVDEGDNPNFEAEFFCNSSVTSRPFSPLSVDTSTHSFSPLSIDSHTNEKILSNPFSPMRPFSPLSVVPSVQTRRSDDSFEAKRRPHVKKYAPEYNMLVSAVSKLFAENDKGADGTSNSADANVIKFGLLSKITHIDVGIGSDVFVELRPGMMTYYKKVVDGERCADVTSVPIRRNRCQLRPTKALEKAPFPKWDAVFEVAVIGYPTIFFMAESKDERIEWMQAFKAAMKSGADKDHHQLDESREDNNGKQSANGSEVAGQGYNADILLYLHVRGLIQGSCSKDEYMDSLSILLGKTITMPVHWLREYFDDSPSIVQCHEDTPEEWERLADEIISVNGHIGRGGLDSTIESIKSHIIDLDKCSCTQNDINQPRITESQGIFFARDILLSCDRSKSEEQSIYCTSRMLGNDQLAFLTPSSADDDPLKISLRSLRNTSLNHEIDSASTSSSADSSKRDGHDRCNNYKCTVEVTVRATSIYRVYNTDLLDKESWALVRTVYIQKFLLSSSELQRTDPFVQFEIVPCFDTGAPQTFHLYT